MWSDAGASTPLGSAPFQSDCRAMTSASPNFQLDRRSASDPSRKRIANLFKNSAKIIGIRPAWIMRLELLTSLIHQIWSPIRFSSEYVTFLGKLVIDGQPRLVK